MSTPAGGKTGIGLGLGVGLGCAAGCLLLIVGVVGVGFWMTSTVAKQMETAMAEARLADESRKKLAALDEAHPPRLPEDLAQAALQPADIDAYLVAWQRIGPQLARHAEIQGRLESLGEDMEGDEQPSFRDMMNVMREAQSAISDVASLEADLIDSTGGGLIAAQIGPTDFRRLLEIIEWRFLGRDEASGLGVASATHWEIESATERAEKLEELLANPQTNEAALRFWLADEPSDGASMAELRQAARKEGARARARLDALGAEASEARTLSKATLAVLEARRPELEARTSVNLSPLIDLLDSLSWSESDDDWSDSGDEATDDESAAGGGTD